MEKPSEFMESLIEKGMFLYGNHKPSSLNIIIKEEGSTTIESIVKQK